MIYNCTKFKVTKSNSSIFFIIICYFNVIGRKIHCFYLYFLTCLPYEASNTFCLCSKHVRQLQSFQSLSHARSDYCRRHMLGPKKIFLPCLFIKYSCYSVISWAGQLCRYSDCATGWTVWDRIPVGDEISRPSRPVLGPTQPPVKWVPVLYRG